MSVRRRTYNDAPSDGNEYVRQDGAWVLNTGGSGAVPEAPNDAYDYARGSLAWTNDPTFLATNVDHVDFNTAAGYSVGEGELAWNTADGCLNIGMVGGDVILQVGLEHLVYAKAAENLSNGDVVYASGAVGVSSHPEASKFTANGTIEPYLIGGLVTDDFTLGNFGYICMQGVVRSLDTSAWPIGTVLYCSPTVAGGMTSTQPVPPDQAIPIAIVLVSHATQGSVYTRLNPPYSLDQLHDVHITSPTLGDALLYNGGFWHADKIGYDNLDEDITGFTDSWEGMSFDKHDLYVVDDGGLQFEIEKQGGGDVDYWLGNQRATLDCTTGSGTGGRARVALTAGSDANNPATNFIYVTASGSTATLAASTTEPTGAFGWVGKVVVPDATTWATTGEYLIQRTTESMENNSRGLFSHEREKIRSLGTTYLTGGTSTVAITTNGGSPDNVHVEVNAATVSQLHRQSFPAFTTGPYYYGNGTTPYTQITDLNQALSLVDGTAITNNQRYNLVIWGAVNYSTGDCKLFVNLPTDTYLSDEQAKADTNNTADFSVPSAMRTTAFMIARVVLKYTTASGGTFTSLEAYSLLGTPPGVRSGGASAVAATDFLDTEFRVEDDLDTTKKLAFECSGITTGNTRTITIPDYDMTLIDWTNTSSSLLTTGNISSNGGTVYTNDIREYNTANGVTVDSILLKDNYVQRDVNNSFIALMGGSDPLTDTYIQINGSGAAAGANDVNFVTGTLGSTVLKYDHSAPIWDFQSVDMQTLGNTGLGQASVDAIYAFTPRLSVRATAAIQKWANNTASADLYFTKSRNTGVDGHTIVQNGDGLGWIAATGSDGTDFDHDSTGIYMFVDGTPAASSIPGAISFYTAAAGSQYSSERMRITSAGDVGIGYTNPQAKLDIMSDLQFAAGIIVRGVSGAANSWGRIDLVPRNSADTAWDTGGFLYASGTVMAFRSDVTGCILRYNANSSTGRHDFRVNNVSQGTWNSTGLGVDNSSPQTSLHVGGGVTFDEITAPSTPAANDCVLYAKDNGSGKTQLVVKMPDGVETVLATQT